MTQLQWTANFVITGIVYNSQELIYSAGIIIYLSLQVDLVDGYWECDMLWVNIYVIVYRFC